MGHGLIVRFLFMSYLSKNVINEPFTAEEFLYLNQWGEIALLSVGNLSERILMSNTTYVSIIAMVFHAFIDTTSGPWH